MSVAEVVGQITGHEPSERQIIDVAKKTPSTDHPGSVYIKPADPRDPNSGYGTDPVDEIVLLAHYRVHATYTDLDNTAQGGPTGMPVLEQHLANKHAVIVGVNAETVWKKPGQTEHADHAVVVTGVDTGAGVVHLNDSGTPHGRDEKVDITLFEQAWATSGDQMVVTDETVK